MHTSPHASSEIPQSAIRNPQSVRAFTLVELLVVLGILVVLVSIFVPYGMSIRESRNRIACADNLRQINAAIGMYVNEPGNRRNYPRVVYDAEGNPNGWTALTGPDAEDPFVDASAVRPNDVTASLWLLVRMKMVGPGAFVCPATGDTADPLTDDRGQRVDVERRGNFRSRSNLSYSYAQPFSTAIEYRIDDARPAYFVLMADRNPGRSSGHDVTEVKPGDGALSLRRGNSRNHGGAGQNVLYVSGVVEFVSTPFCGSGYVVDKGQAGDNIYTALRKTPLEAGNKPPADQPGVIGEDVGPAWAEDSYLVPYEK